jgi:hypothetical protein
MDNIPLDLFYKGDRNYIQGGDFYNRINFLAPKIAGSSDTYLAHLVFRNFCRNDADIYLYPPDSQKALVGTGRIVSKHEDSQKIWIVESNRRIAKRYPFDEKEITAQSIIEASRITLSQKTGYSPIEEVIALTKALSYKTNPNIQGKWVFGQLDLNRPFLHEYHKVHIVQKATVAGRFLLCAIYQDSLFTGDIRFIVGEP